MKEKRKKEKRKKGKKKTHAKKQTRNERKEEEKENKKRGQNASFELGSTFNSRCIVLWVVDSPGLIFI